MSSVQYLREFIKERLTAVCEEIFSEVQIIIVQYEEEIDRQHRLLDISRKPDTNSHIKDLPQQHDCEEEEGLDEQQVCNQEGNSSLDQEDPEPPQIKEEQEKLCSSQEGEQLGLKQETEGIIVWTDEECVKMLETIWKPQIKLHRIDLQQQHVCEEEVLTDQEVCNQERNCSLAQEDPESPQIKEEQEELCSSQDREQLGLKQDAETFMETPAYDPEPNSEQLLSRSFPEAESQDQEESQHADSGLTRRAKPKKRRRNRKLSHRKRRLNNRVDNAVLSESHNKSDTGKKSLNCDTCGKTFRYNCQLIVHLRVHTGEKPYSCKTCGKKFRIKEAVKTHMRYHTGEKPYSCSICGKRFTVSSTLKTHVQFHSGEKPHCCSICGRRFCLKSALNYHQRYHAGERPHICSTCGKRFFQKSDLRRHIRVHTGEKPYSCSTCGKKFSCSSAVKSHQKVHVAVKPYYCKTCGKTLADSSQLITHMKVHADENLYYCNICSKGFHSKTSLKCHMRIHTVEKPYCCNTCGERFIRQPQLLKHIKIHTG